jgi:hypothetical protein
VKLVASIRLLPTPEQAVLLRDTLERCNAGCNWLAGLAADTKTRRQFDLHKLAYAALRARFGLYSQAVVRCIAKVADSLDSAPSSGATWVVGLPKGAREQPRMEPHGRDHHL